MKGSDVVVFEGEQARFEGPICMISLGVESHNLDGHAVNGLQLLSAIEDARGELLFTIDGPSMHVRHDALEISLPVTSHCAKFDFPAMPTSITLGDLLPLAEMAKMVPDAVLSVQNKKLTLFSPFCMAERYLSEDIKREVTISYDLIVKLSSTPNALGWSVAVGDAWRLALLGAGPNGPLVVTGGPRAPCEDVEIGGFPAYNQFAPILPEFFLALKRAKKLSSSKMVTAIPFVGFQVEVNTALALIPCSEVGAIEGEFEFSVLEALKFVAEQVAMTNRRGLPIVYWFHKANKSRGVVAGLAHGTIDDA